MVVVFPGVLLLSSFLIAQVRGVLYSCGSAYYDPTKVLDFTEPQGFAVFIGLVHMFQRTRRHSLPDHQQRGIFPMWRCLL